MSVELTPTVYQAAQALIRKNRNLISELQDEISAAEVRLRTQAFANMLEAERIANKAEPFQLGSLNVKQTKT